MAGFEEKLRMIASLVFASVFTWLSYNFFMYSVSLLYANPPRVTAGLMAGLAGFAFISAAVTILRDWLIVRAAERLTQKEGER